MRAHPAHPNHEPRASLRRAPTLVPRAPRAPRLTLGGAARQVYLAQTVIAWGVPAAVVGFLVISVVRGARGPKGDPLDDEAPPSPLALAFGKPRTPGEPAELQRKNETLCPSITPKSKIYEKVRPLHPLSMSFRGFHAYGYHAPFLPCACSTNHQVCSTGQKLSTVTWSHHRVC